MSTEKSYFPALTGIRALAMYMVFIQHYDPFSPSDLGGYAVKFINEFYVALIMFFVLSGFLITYRYYDRPGISLRMYVVNRIARVYPMYFVITALTFVIAADQVMYDAGDLSATTVFLANVTFLRGFFADLLFSGVPQGWSLTPEEAFYMSAPIAFLLFKRSWSSLVLIPIALLVVGFLLVRMFGGHDDHGFMADDQFMLVYTFFGLSATFYSGAALAVLYSKHRERIKVRHPTLIGGTMTLLYMGFAAALKGDLPFAVQHPIGYAVSMTILPTLGIGMLLWGLMTEVTWFSRFLSTKPMILLGDSSLTFYLIHMGVLADQMLHISNNTTTLCLVTTAVAIMLNRLIERPLDRLIRRAGRKPLRIDTGSPGPNEAL